MIVAWLMNTVEPTLRTTISMVDDAHILWEDLKLQFSVGNGPRVHELKSDLANCKQKEDSVMMFFGNLKKMWDELAVYKPLRSCSCGELAAQLEQDRDEERTHQFLMGLDDVRFGGIRSTLTNMLPMLKLSQVYQRVVRDKRQQSITCDKEERSEAVGFAVQAANQGRPGVFQYREKDTTCTHCGKYIHDIGDCFQIKGYPEWWGERGRNFGDSRGGVSRGGGRGRFGRGGGIAGSTGRGRGSSFARANVAQTSHDTVGSANSAQVHPVAHSAAAPQREGGFDRASLPHLSDDQWTALVGLLTKPKSGDSSSKLSGPYFEDVWCG
ncbi:PREDICTED: uncharacterized protein LOC104787325 [Camelina sativa]|uniref:Uncharacterized protein LOC104787325 n=1 Tax=Camelina sativa TaxID=90675 RepID=A0ABM0Z6P8_CAMSA|nr:PREDICTED: uncharacterized protein LOC104787325 [Camelina sativa]